MVAKEVMMEVAATASARRLRRSAYAVLALALLGVVVYLVAATSAPWWQAVAFGVAPDIALFAGLGSGLAKGQLHPRAVPLYNALHRFWGPLALALVAAVGLIPSAFLVGALAWALHVALDRSVGYGLRTPDGFQRG
jgi:hypothetical protein